MKKDKQYTIDELKNAMKNKQAFEAYIEEVDEEFNLHCVFAGNNKGIIPREEVSCVVQDDGLVDSGTLDKSDIWGYIVNIFSPEKYLLYSPKYLICPVYTINYILYYMKMEIIF